MCFFKITTHKISSGITCFKVMYFKDGKLIPEFHPFLSYELGDTIHAANIPDIELPFKYWFKKKDFRKKIKKELAVTCIDKKYSYLEGQVVHSFSSKRRATLWRTGESLVIVECLIPEGEIYWENVDIGQYASFSIKLLRIL